MAQHTQSTQLAQQAPREWVLDLLRLASWCGIVGAHTIQVDDFSQYPLWFWLCNDFSALMFVAVMGVSSTLSRKTSPRDKTLYYHAAIIASIGLCLSVVTPAIITVLPTLACVMVLLRWLPDTPWCVLGSSAVAIISVAISWCFSLTHAYNIDVTSVERYGLGNSVLAFFVTGAYGLTRWLMVAVVARYIWNRRAALTARVCSSRVALLHSVAGCSVFSVAWIGYFFAHPLSGYIDNAAVNSDTGTHVQHIYTSVPDYRTTDVIDVISSVHAHGGSVIVCVPVLLVIGIVSVISQLSGTYVRNTGLTRTETVSSWYYNDNLINRPRRAFFNLSANCLSLYILSVVLDNVFVIYQHPWENYLFALSVCLSTVFAWLMVFQRAPVETWLKKL